MPSAQMIASPVKTPRLPSSQLTSVPWRVQDCAMAGEAAPAAMANIEIENRSVRVIVMPPSAVFIAATVNRRAGRPSGSQPRQASYWKSAEITLYIQSIGEISETSARAPLPNPSCPFKRGHPERWPSGLRRTLGKRVCGKPYRGFESHSLRQPNSDRRTS